jgi:hypothetical protein
MIRSPKPLLRICMVGCLWAALLAAACQQPETPQRPPNSTDTPSGWMLDCFTIVPSNDRLRAAGARDEIELTAQPVSVVEGRQWYRVEMNGSHLKYGRWPPLSSSQIRIEIGFAGSASLSYVLSRVDDHLAGTYREVTDASPRSSPEVPVTFRQAPCASAPAR